MQIKYLNRLFQSYRIFCFSIITLFFFSGESKAQSSSEDSIIHLYENSNDLYKHREYISKFHHSSKTYSPKIKMAFELLLNEAIRLNDSTYVIDFANSLGVHFYYKDNLKISTEYYFKALKYCNPQSEELIKKKAELYNNIAWNFMRLSDNKQALKYFSNALELKDKIDDELLSLLYNNIGVVYSKIGEYDRSLEYYNQSLDINKKSKDLEKQMYNLNNIGKIYYYKKEYFKAADFFLEALETNKKENFEREILNNYYNLAKIYFDLEHSELAFKYYKLALVYCDSLDMIDLKSNIYYDLAILEEKEGKFKNAFSYFKKYKILDDSMDHTRTRADLIDLESQYLLEMKERENRALIKENQIKQLRIKNQSLLNTSLGLGGGIITVLSVVLFIYLRKRNKANKELIKLNSQISEQHKELEQKSWQLSEANAKIKDANENLESRIKSKTDQLSVEKKVTDKLLNSLPGVFFFYHKTNGNFELKRWNRNHEIISGFSYSELMNKSVYDFFNDEYTSLVKKQLENSKKPGKLNLEAKILKKDGSLSEWHFIEAYMFNENNEEYLIGMGINIQDKKSAESELQKRTYELKEHNEKLKSYAYYNAHKLRGPFCRVKGLLQLENSPKVELPKNYEQLLIKSIQELESVINDIQKAIT